jgi:hypothetical protein
MLNLGFLPGSYLIVADGLTVPSHVTSPVCGVFELAIPVGPIGLPPGIAIRNQGVVISPASVPPPPNGVFHITDLEILNT